MPIPLAVLIVEDVKSDAQLLVRLFKKADYELVYEQVESAEQMRSALEKRTWDIIISDYNLPQFDGHAALKILQSTGRDIPFIVVSGAIGEETAVSMMKAGAHDYLIKGNLARLVPAVERELVQAGIRRARKQAEDALRASEDRYRTLVESSPDSICIHCEGKIVYVNAAALKLFHAACAEDMIGRPAIDFVHPDFRAVAMERVRQSYENRQESSLLEEKFITRDGKPIEVEVIGAPINYEGKAATQIIIRDIAERKRSEEALHESATKLETLIQVSPLAIILLDPNGNVLIWNPSAERIFGWTMQEIIGHPNPIVPTEKQEEYQTWSTQVNKGESINNHETKRQRKDGSLVNVSISSARVYDGMGNLKGRMAIIADISERKHAEAALAASEAEFRALVEQVPAIVYTESAEIHETLYVSPQVEKLTGYTPAEWIKDRDTWKQMTHPEDLAALLAEDERTDIDYEPFQIEYRILTRDGRTLWLRDEAVIIKDRDGKPLFWQGVMHDITERKQAEELLRQQSEQLRLLYEASQRLNSTLDLYEIYQTICDFMSVIAPNDALSISAFDPETQLISCRAFWADHNWLDVSPFPSIPLEAEGKGTQSIVIRTGQSMLVNDYQALMKTVQTSYVVNGETNEVSKEAPPDEDITRSALIVPLKVGGRVSGVIQALSYRLNAYTEDQLKLLESLALHIASAQQNALLYAQVQTELNERKQAQESMRTTNILLEQTLEQSPIPMVLVSMPDGTVRSANSACRRFLGVEDEFFAVGTPLSELKASWQDFDMQGNPATAENLPLPASLRGIKSIQERHIIRKDGTSVYGLIYGSPIFDTAGNLIAGYLVMVDITERKQTEKALQMSEERYRGLFNSMIDGFALHEIICDENGKPVDYRFLEVNPAFERLTGLQSVNLIGKTVLEVLPDTEHYWIEIYGNVALTGNSAFYENYSLELGRYFEVSVYCPQPRQFAVITVDVSERKRAQEDIHQRMAELEMLYQSGLALSQLLNPKEIGQKILELLQEKLDWHHTRIRLYDPESDTLELLDFNQPGLKDESERHEAVERFQSLITRSSQGMSGWAIQHGQPVRFGDVSNDSHYVEAYPGIRSGLYVPMKLGERTVGVISIESENPDAFSAEDERLIVTLANQAASAFENARLFEETRQRVMELETLNRISLVLRAVSKQSEMLSIVLDEALAILNTSHGSIELYNKTTDCLDKTITRGWMTQLSEPPHHNREGIAGKVFATGETYVSCEFARDPETRAAIRSQIPIGWGGICLPIRTTQQTLGVLIVSVPSEHELNKDEIRLLATLSEMTGAALQRMQLHEQTVRRLQQLHALRAVDQAISSSRDMRLTLNVLLTHTISQLEVDAADVLLLHPGSNLLELVAAHGFHTLPPESVRLNDSFAVQSIMEHRFISARDFEIVNKYPHFWKLWKAEGFVCYWCVPLTVKGEVKGVLEIYRRAAFTPDAEWLEFLESLAGQAAIAIDSTELFENLQRANLDLGLAYEATIEGWSRAMDLRDHETEGHTLRVTDLTLKLARDMRISESQLMAIRRGALLHDIGKMGVPDAILLKEGQLTDEEWVLMRRHPQFARDMLAPIAYLNDALNIPYCHHEKWDGTGYPQGLKGDSIPLVARIFAIVDVWDALTNDRTYRKKWTKQKARQYIKEQSGKHFDPQVVDVFLKNIEKMS